MFTLSIYNNSQLISEASQYGQRIFCEPTTSTCEISCKMFLNDVFLSFTGEDTRRQLVDHLCRLLRQRGLITVTDEKGFERGEEITRSRLDSIERSQISIVVFSKNYACSTWCLDELVKIIECVKGKGQSILPIFYHVDPFEVGHVRGGYRRALAKHLQKSQYSSDKVSKWAKALREVANLSGSGFDARYESEAGLVGKIVEAISGKASRFPLPVANYRAGLEARVLKLRSLLDVGSDCEVKMIGIWGMGGLGKTTLARVVYNDIAAQFERFSFLHDIRENSTTKCGLVRLQERLLSDLFEDKTIDPDLDSVNMGISILPKMLSGERVLVVLDDVDHLEQLQALAGGCAWFGSGSRIIITTRDRRVLDGHGVGTLLDLNQFNASEDPELLSSNAFRTNAVDPSYLDASRRALPYPKGRSLDAKSRSGSFKVLTTSRMDVSRALKYVTLCESITVKGKIRSLKLLYTMGYPSSFTSDIDPWKAAMLDLHFRCLNIMKLKSCQSLRELPDLSGLLGLSKLHLQNCKNLTKIHHSIGYLHTLRSLYIHRCSNLETLPPATKLKPFALSGCSSLQTYPKISLQMKFVGKAKPAVLPKLTHLDLSECNLSDPSLAYLVYFPSLQNLNLAGNNFTILPAYIKECSRLSYLSLDDCKHLRKIEGIPPNIELFRASNCTSLTPTSSAMLLSQELHEAGNTQFILPGSRIPEWFDHFNWGGSVSFWMRKKFPPIALCFVLCSSRLQLRMRKFHMLINGKYLFDFDYNYFLELETDHIMLFDLRSQIANTELEEILLDDDWNHVQVSCVDAPSLEGSVVEKEIVRCIGVYVYKQLSSMEDIQFANPNSGKSKGNFFCCSGDLELYCNPLLKRLHKFLDMGAFQTPNMYRQNNIGSVTQNNPEIFKNVCEDREKYSTVYSGAEMQWDIDFERPPLLPSLQPLAGADVMLNPVGSETTSDLNNEKDVKRMDKFCKVCESFHLWKSRQTSTNQRKPVAGLCVQSRQTQVEKIHTQVPENSGYLRSFSEEDDGNLISMKHCMGHVDSSFNDIALKAAHVSIESVATDLSRIVGTETNNESSHTKLSDEAMKALQILQDYVTNRFSFLLDPGRSRFLKIILDYLLSLSEDDGISMRMRSVLLQLSRSFTLWSRDYDAASVRLELTAAELLKMDKHQVDIEAIVKEQEEVDSLKDELGSKLAALQERKRGLEEELHAITEAITELRFPGGTVYDSKQRVWESKNAQN